MAGLLLLSLLSGCVSSAVGNSDLKLADGKTVDLNAAAQGAQSENAADRGIISGVIVDPAIRPISGANLTVLGQGVTAQADANGVFVIPNLKPGLYTVQAEAKGYLKVQSTAEVKSGETTKVRMVMDFDRTPVPFHSPTIKFKGFFQVSFTGLVDEALDLFVFNQTHGPVTTPERPACTCHFTYHPERNATTHVIEIAWTPSPDKPDDPTGQLGPPEIVMDFNPDHPPAPALTFCYGSPCVTRFDGKNLSADLSGVDLGFWGDSTWPAVNEDFTVFVTLFYNGAAPSGWSFIKGDT